MPVLLAFILESIVAKAVVFGPVFGVTAASVELAPERHHAPHAVQPEIYEIVP